jgi:hypothetical protein
MPNQPRQTGLTPEFRASGKHMGEIVISYKINNIHVSSKSNFQLLVLAATQGLRTSVNEGGSMDFTSMIPVSSGRRRVDYNVEHAVSTRAARCNCGRGRRLAEHRDIERSRTSDAVHCSVHQCGVDRCTASFIGCP